MLKLKKVTALLGSTRGNKTVTESIADYLKKEFRNYNVNLIKFRAHQIFQDEKEVSNFIKELKDSDVFLIVSPVYVHSLPYPVINLMEKLEVFTNKKFWKDKFTTAVIHNGYPQDIQRKSSKEICYNFSNKMGSDWLGTLGFGGSPLIAGKPLEEVGWFTKNMRKSLDEFSKNIINQNKISSKAYKYEKKHFPPIPLYILKFLMNILTKKEAKKKGIDLYAQPHKKNIRRR